MASAGDGNDDPRPPRPPQPGGNVRHVIRIPLLRPGQPQRITIRYAGPPQGQQGGQRPQIRIVRLPRQGQGQGQGQGQAHASAEDVSRRLREREEEARREAEESHRRAQLRTALNTIQTPEVEYCQDEGVVRVSWQPLEVPGGDQVEYTVSSWRDGAGDPAPVYKGQLTSCVVTTETLCRGHTHQIAVCASASGETGDYSQRSEVEIPALPPDQPPPPKIASKTKNAVMLRWNAPAANGSAIIEYCLEWDQGTGDFENLFVGKAKQFKFSHKFPPGSQSLFRVRARNAIGWSEYSDEMVHNVGQAAPSVPPSPSLSSSTPHSLTLHWNVPPGQTLVTLFCLEMDDPNKGYGFYPVYQGDGLSYMCRELERVTTYSFRLSAANEAGSSPTSHPVSFTTLPEPPGCPGAICLSDRPQSTSLNLEWSPPTNDGGSPVESYILQVDDGVGGEMRDTYKGSEVNHQLTSLAPGKSYRCRVCAVSSGGQGAWSEEALFKTPPTLPRPPSGLSTSGKVTQYSAVISWGPPASDGGSSITSYEIQRRPTEEGEWESAGAVPEQLSFSSSSSPSRSSHTPSLTHTLTHLTPGMQYEVRVSCRNSVGLSEWSESIEFTTAPGAPSSPSTLSVTMVTAHLAQLQWKPSAEFGSPVTGYVVEWGVVGGARHTLPHPPSPRVASLTNLSPDTQHTARVKAVSEAGHSEWSSSVTFTTSPSTPSPPSHLALVSSTPDSLLVAWSIPPSPGSPLTHYHIHLLPPPTPDSAPLVIPPTETQVSLHDLEPNTQYMVRVQAENGVGLGPLSSPLLATTLPPPPLPPSLSLISCTATSLRVSWGKKTSKSISYTLQLASDSGRFHTVYSGPAVAHKLQRLNPDTKYTLRIAATSESGQGAWSDLLTYETLPPAPSAPANLALRQEDDVIVMSWADVKHSQPVTYELQLKVGAQDFTQVYRGSAPSHTHPITTHTRHQARVRACASCHANNRKEQLFSGFSAVVSCDTTTTTPSDETDDVINETITTEAPPIKEGVLSRNWLPLLFVVVSIVVVAIAILFGQLLVTS